MNDNYIEKYFWSLTPEIAKLSKALHQKIMDFEGIRCEMRYGMPLYIGKFPICFQNVFGHEAIELAFSQGHSLKNTPIKLDFRGRKYVGGIVISDIMQLESPLLRELLEEALAWDTRPNK